MEIFLYSYEFIVTSVNLHECNTRTTLVLTDLSIRLQNGNGNPVYPVGFWDRSVP